MYFGALRGICRRNDQVSNLGVNFLGSLDQIDIRSNYSNST